MNPNDHTPQTSKSISYLTEYFLKMSDSSNPYVEIKEGSLCTPVCIKGRGAPQARAINDPLSPQGVEGAVVTGISCLTSTAISL